MWDADKGGKGCFRCVFDLFSTFLRFFSIVFRVFSSFLSFWTCTTTLQRLEKEIGGGTTQMAFEAADHPLPFSSHSLPSRHLPLNLPVPLPTPPPRAFDLLLFLLLLIMSSQKYNFKNIRSVPPGKEIFDIVLSKTQRQYVIPRFFAAWFPLFLRCPVKN